MSYLGEDGLPNLLNNLFERRFQVIKGGVHCFVFGFALPNHSAHVQRTDEGLGIVVLSNFNLPPPPWRAPPPNAASLYLVDIISFHVAFGGGRWGRTVDEKFVMGVFYLSEPARFSQSSLTRLYEYESLNTPSLKIYWRKIPSRRNPFRSNNRMERSLNS
jgi:hypothetical protein